MAKVNAERIATLKGHFEHGEVITEAHLADLIDALAEAAQEHEHVATGGPGSGTGDAAQLDHGGLTGLGDDDHQQYLNTARHDTINRHNSNIIRGVQSGLDQNKPSSPAAGDMYIATDTAKVYVCYSAGTWTEIGGGGGGGTQEDYVYVRDKRPTATNGGTFTAGAWQTRVINEEVVDTGNICSISDNQITLAAGEYRCFITAPAHGVRNHVARLFDVTNNQQLLLGTNEYSRSDYPTTTRSIIVGRFVLTGTTVLRIEHQCSYTVSSSGFGYGNTFTENIFTTAEFWRKA